MRATLILVALCVLALGLAVGVVRVIGSTVPLSSPFAAQLALDAQIEMAGSQWCWRGLCPGQVGTRKAEIVLADYAQGTVLRELSTVYWYSGEVSDTKNSVKIAVNYSDDAVFFVQITPPLQRFTFGDALAKFGRPHAIFLYSNLGNWIQVICFEHGVCAGGLNNSLRITPYVTLNVISMQRETSTADTERRLPNRYRWHGFGRLWIR